MEESDLPFMMMISEEVGEIDQWEKVW
jgi:hypothetical protein